MTTTPRTAHKQCKAGSLPEDALVVPITLSANLEFELNKALQDLQAIADRVGAKSSWVLDIIAEIDSAGVPMKKQQPQSSSSCTHMLIWGRGKHVRRYYGEAGAHAARRKLIQEGYKDATVREVRV